MTAPLPASLTELEARRRTREIRGALSSAVRLLASALDERIWEAYSPPYANPEAYFAAELPELSLLRLAVEDRVTFVRAMRSTGASVGSIAKLLRVSKSTVNGDRNPASEPATIRTADGKTRASSASKSSRPAPKAGMPKTDRVVELILAAGPDGLTCLEIEQATGWRHGIASGPLSRVAARGRVARGLGYREGYGVYVGV